MYQHIYLFLCLLFHYSTLLSGITFLQSKMHTFQVSLVKLCSLHTLSFYLFEHVFILVLLLGRLFTDYRLLDLTLFYVNILKILFHLLLASRVTVENPISLIVILFFSGCFYDFPFVFDILQFYYYMLKYRFLLFFLGFINITECVLWFFLQF